MPTLKFPFHNGTEFTVSYNMKKENEEALYEKKTKTLASDSFKNVYYFTYNFIKHPVRKRALKALPLQRDRNAKIARAVDAVMARTKRIYILIIKINE